MPCALSAILYPSALMSPPEKRPPLPGPASLLVSAKKSKLAPISVYVSHGVAAVRWKAAASGRAPRPAHSGQRMPTAACVMHSAQIGRPQFEHESSVSRPGWR